MSAIKFNFSAFGKPKVKKTKDANNKKIVERNILGVINITLEGKYYVHTDTEDYSLTLESYDIKGKNVFYTIELFDNKFQEIIRLNKATRNYKKYFKHIDCQTKHNLTYSNNKSNSLNNSA